MKKDNRNKVNKNIKNTSYDSLKGVISIPIPAKPVPFTES